MAIKEFQNQYRWLSNFWPCSIEWEGYMWPSVEYAYQGAKCEDDSDKILILDANSPKEAKRIGKRVKLRKDWDSIKLYIMLALIRQKFSIPELRDRLLATNDEYIQEGNRWKDAFWGIDLKTGKGNNYLGKIIMQVREEIKHEKS